MREVTRTVVLSTKELCLQFAQYDSYFSFYDTGLKDVICRAYLTAPSVGAGPWFVNWVLEDFHAAHDMELEFHNEQAREYLREYAAVDGLLVARVAAEVFQSVHKDIQHFLPEPTLRFTPHREPIWLGDDLLVSLHEVEERDV